MRYAMIFIVVAATTFWIYGIWTNHLEIIGKLAVTGLVLISLVEYLVDKLGKRA